MPIEIELISKIISQAALLRTAEGGVRRSVGGRFCHRRRHQTASVEAVEQRARLRRTNIGSERAG